MGSFLCRHRLSSTKKEINQLKSVVDLKEQDLHDIYLRFENSYPYGYLNLQEFIDYFQKLNEESYLDKKDLFKDLFDLFDLNQDQKLDFNEFILFNQLISNGTDEEKLNKLFEIYQNEKEKSFNKNQLIDLLVNLFDVFNIYYSKSNLKHFIRFIFHKNHLKHHENINWHLFRKEIRENVDLFDNEVLHFDNDRQIIQRSERF